MKQSKISPSTFPIVFLLLGALACFCTRWALTSSLDELGLIIPATLPEILLWVLVAAALVLAFVCSGKCTTGGKNNVLPAIGELIYAVGVYTLIITPAKGPETMVLLFRVFSWAAAACLIASAAMRLMKKTPFFLLTVPVCILAIFFLAECYQLWSEVPQLLEYAMGVGAVLGLLLFSFQRMARSAAIPEKPRHIAYGFLGIFFCTAAASLGVYSMYLIAAALWIAADLIAACSPASQEA